MSKYRYKKPAKYVGWIDLIRHLISMVLLVPTVVVVSKMMGSNKYAETAVVFGTVHFVIQAFASVALIDGTTGAKKPNRSLWLIRIWWFATIIFIGLDCLVILIIQEFPALAFVVLPIIFLGIVKEFVDELKGICPTPSESSENSVGIEDSKAYNNEQSESREST